MVLIWFWCLYSKKRFLLKGDLELLSSEDFECFGVAFLYGPAFSMFMLGSSSGHCFSYSTFRKTQTHWYLQMRLIINLAF